MGDFIPEAQVKGLDGDNLIAFICNKCEATDFSISMFFVMAQKYKVFFNGHIVFLCKKKPENLRIDIHHKYTSTDNLKKLLFEHLQNKPEQIIWIEWYNYEKLWKEFSSLFRVKEAAGGLVYNQNHEWLFIKRKGLWDLPKGHLEKNEELSACAMREVTEECGITHLKIVKPLLTTFHTYYIKNEPILKPSHWFLMEYDGNESLKPQISESISEARWVKADQIEELLTNSFPSIGDVARYASR